VAGGRPHGHPPRRPGPGNPRQPAGGRQEREAPELRQPALRQLVGKAAGSRVPGGAPVPSLHHRLDGRPRRGIARGRAGLLPHLLRSQQRNVVDRRRLRARRRLGLGGEALRPDPREPRHPCATRGSPAGPHRSRGPPGRPRPGPDVAAVLRIPGTAVRHARVRRPHHGHHRPRPGQGQPTLQPPRAGRGAGPGRGPRRLRMGRRRGARHGMVHRPQRARAGRPGGGVPRGHRRPRQGPPHGGGDDASQGHCRAGRARSRAAGGGAGGPPLHVRHPLRQPGHDERAPPRPARRHPGADPGSHRVVLRYVPEEAR